MARVAIEFDKQQTFLTAMQSVSRQTQIKHLACLKHDATEEATTSALKDEIARVGLTKSDALVVVSRSDVELRLLDVPPAPENELPAMVRFVAKNEFASLNDSWLLDFVRLSGDDKTPGKVLAAGLAPERKELIQKTVEEAGLRLKKINFRPLEVANYLSRQLANDNLRLLIECDKDTANISLFDGRSMFATRTIRIVGSDIAKSLEREVKRTVSNADISADQFDEILLLGPAEAVEPLGESLSKTLSTKHRIIDPTKDRSVGQKLQSVDNHHRYVPLLGALGEHRPDATPTMDFVNPRKVEVKKADFSKWYMYGAIAAVGLLLLFAFGYWRLSSQSSEIAELTKKRDKIRSLNNGESNRTAVDETLKRVGKVDDWVVARINWQDVLLGYSEHALTADDAIVDSLIASHKGPTHLTIKARIADQKTENNLVKELQKQSEFITTNKGSKTLNGEFSIESEIDIELKREPSKLLQAINKRADSFLAEQSAARAAAYQNKTSSN